MLVELLSWLWTIALEPKENDITVENKGLKIFIGKEIEVFIKGPIIHFDKNRGFYIVFVENSEGDKKV